MKIADLHRQRGAAMVEFALACTIFLGLTFGMVEFAVDYTINGELNYAAEVGARLAMVSGSNSAKPATQASLTQFVLTKLHDLDKNKVHVDVNYYTAAGVLSQSCNQRYNCEVEVIVTYPYHIVLSIPVVNRTVTLRGESRMPIAF